MTDKSSPNEIGGRGNSEGSTGSKRKGRSWLWRALGIIAVFLAWLLYGGEISLTGMVIGGVLIGCGGIMTWLAYKQ